MTIRIRVRAPAHAREIAASGLVPWLAGLVPTAEPKQNMRVK